MLIKTTYTFEIHFIFKDALNSQKLLENFPFYFGKLYIRNTTVSFSLNIYGVGKMLCLT